MKGVREQDLAAVRRELARGSNVDGLPDAAYVEGISPLNAAAEKGDRVMVRLLLDRGADVNRVDGWGYTPLTWAAAGGHARVVELLISRGARVSDGDGGSVALRRAAVEGKRTTVALLLAHGADPGMATEGKSLIDIVRDEGHTDIAAMLHRATVRH